MRLDTVPARFRAGAAAAANDLGARSRRAHRDLDPRVARALAAIEARPDARWSVAKLAKLACLSRAAFARRFVADVGAPPLRHVTEARVRRAAELVASSDAPLAEIAARVGYANEFALSRAFRRVLGAPPSAFRSARRASAPATRASTGPIALARAA